MIQNRPKNQNTLKTTILFARLKVYFMEFCKHTGLHGFQYFEEPGRSIFERYWWFLVLAILYTSCVYAVHLTYKKWERSPVIVNFSNRGTPIYKIPFPSVTICPEVQSGSQKFNYTKVLHKKEDGLPLTPEEEKYFEYFSLLCEQRQQSKKIDTFPEDFFDVLNNFKPDFYVMNCSLFSSKSIDCKSIFTPIITEHGVCYSFNILNKSQIFRDTVWSYKNYHTVSQIVTNWTIEDGYDENTEYPFRAYLSGINKGLSLNIFTPHEDLDYACRSPFQGYRVLLYTPMTIPRPSLKYFRLPLDRSVAATVDPTMIETSPSVRKYNPKTRGCYFQQERYLKYFKLYTLNNCKLECVTNYTLHLCDCVSFFMPRESGTKICGTGKLSCVENAEEIMQYADLGKKSHHANVHFKSDFHKKCHCLPLCSDLVYEVQSSHTHLDWPKWTAARRTFTGVENASISSLTVYFTAENFIHRERNELYGPLDFLANFGGLIGLFTGVSLLSFVEIAYFSTIRLFCSLRMRR